MTIPEAAQRKSSALSESDDAEVIHLVYGKDSDGVARVRFVRDRRLTLPDVAGLSLAQAALAYADAGWFVLPTDPDNIKNPGSVVGGRWHEKSSRDPKQIRTWWAENPDYGIALHVGRSGAVVFDFDRDNLDAIPSHLAEALRSADAIQLTRPSGDRGHYLFAKPEGATFGNRAGAFAAFGEVRGENGVIIAAPTPHPDGGEYRWARAGGIVTPPPVALLGCLSEASSVAVMPLSDDGLDNFLKHHGRDDRPQAMRVVLDKFHADVDGGMSRHYALVRALGFGYRDAVAGLYPTKRVTDALDEAFHAAYDDAATGRRPAPGPTEFLDVARYVAAEVANADPADLRAVKDGFADPENSAKAREAMASGLRTTDAQQDQRSSRPASRSLAEITPTAVRWLWKGWLPRGKVSIFEGDSDVGKSTITLDWAATVSTGRAWPPTVIEGKTLASQDEPAGVLLVGVEDADDDTVVPRLIAAGADLSRIRSLERPVDETGRPTPFTIPDDIDWLRKAIAEADAKLVVIDPITACLSENAKHGVDASIRRILTYVVDLAREMDCAIVLIRHFNKAAGMSAKHRGGGSVAYTALVRSVISAGKLTEPGENGETFAIARTVGNLSKSPAAIGYCLEDAPDDPDLPEPEDDQLRTAVVKWCGTLNLTADQLVGADGAKVGDARKNAPTREECEQVLRELLADGPMRTDEAIKKVREVVGCSVKPVKEAARLMRIVKKPVRSDKAIDHWTWELPPLKIPLADLEGG